MARTGPAERPLSPHLQIYKPSVTMMMSILHRITGAALFFGTLLLVVALLALASGKTSYATVQAIYGSFLGKLVLFGYTWALFHHMFGGIRHFVWDFTRMMDPAGRELAVRLQLGASILLTLLVWAIFVWFK